MPSLLRGLRSPCGVELLGQSYVFRTSDHERHALVRPRRDEVQYAGAARRGRTSRLLDDQAHRRALVHQPQLAAALLAGARRVLGVEKYADLEHGSMTVGTQRTRVHVR